MKKSKDTQRLDYMTERPTRDAVEKALAIADNARALTKPERWQDYGAQINFKENLLLYLVVLAAAYRALEQELADTKKGLACLEHGDSALYCVHCLMESREGRQAERERLRAEAAEHALTLVQAELAASKERIEKKDEALAEALGYCDENQNDGTMELADKLRAALDAGRELGEREGS